MSTLLVVSAPLDPFCRTSQIPQVSFEIAHQIETQMQKKTESLNSQALNFHLIVLFSVWSVYCYLSLWFPGTKILYFVISRE